MVKKFIIPMILSANMLLGSAPAAAEIGDFDSSCSAVPANAWKNIKIAKVYSDITQSGAGFYVAGKEGGVWKVAQSDSYPQKYLTDEMRRISMAALLTGTLVNICANAKTSPSTVWGMQLVN